MSVTRSLTKYGAFARIAVSHARSNRGELYGRMAFFAVILGVFSSLWRATGETGLALGSDPRVFVWYLAGTEWILLSAPLIHLDIQDAIRRGDVVYELGRPVSYVGARLAEGLGVLVARAPLLGLTAFACAFGFTGWTPSIGVIATMLPIGLVASGLLTALYLGIGLLAFWVEDVTPVYWVWQKLLFVFGGLMLPLGLYPEAMQRIAGLTPFPAILAGPASLVLDGQSVAPAALVANLLIWSVVTTLCVGWMFRRAVERMALNGG
jgi:ABC-2 type transport system permease protein